MPRRETKRGAERTPLSGDYDVLICGASFAGLAVARELAGSGARTLIVDRYEIGERQTSACAAPTEWLEAMGVGASMRQTFDTLVVHTPHTTVRFRLPWTFSTFDYRELCGLLYEQCDAEFETAKIEGRVRNADRRPGGSGSRSRPIAASCRAPLVVDALGWKRVLAGSGYQPPQAPLSRGLEVHPFGAGDELEIWIDRAYVPAGYSWSFPAADEVRVGVGLVRSRLPRQGADRAPRRRPRARGGSLPGQLDPAQAALGDRATASSSSATRPATACR